MTKLKYRQFLSDLYDKIGYCPSQSDISKILNNEVSANALSNRYSMDGYIRYDEAKRIKDYFDKQTTDTELHIKAEYYPDVLGSCGGGAFVLSETKEQIEIPLKCFKKPFNKIKKYSVINAYGSSMQPFIFDADRLIIEHCEGETIQDDKVYVFAYDNQIFIKRLYYNVDEIIIKSDNPDPIFKVKYISKEQMNDFILIGQVVGIMRDCR